MSFLEKKLVPKIGLMEDISKEKWIKEQLECIPDKSTRIQLKENLLTHKLTL